MLEGGTCARARTTAQRAAQKRIDTWYNIVTNRVAGEAMIRRALSVEMAVKREYQPLFRSLAACRAWFGVKPPIIGDDAAATEWLRLWATSYDLAAKYDAITLVVRTETDGVLVVQKVVL